ncbi:MAG: lipase family protein [Gammaproteobacteria bacterium]|nr:lipase family protein [Gammaproteobacteria bacterium]
MANILVNSESELNQINDLLDKDIPSYRQAYSDRSAWLMSCMAELAYIRFNPLFSSDKQKEYFLESISKLVNKNKKSSLLKLLDIVGYDHNKEKETLKTELSTLKMGLIETFDISGTQAILVSFNNFIVLAFRGTESTSIKDIKADAKAKTTICETGGKIHTGFKEAFELVRFAIDKKLNEDEFQKKPLFITGHSLGGALATVAAKKLAHKGGLAACYTFGSPRVGDEEWIMNIKTPIYRLVNAADCVTMLPPSSETITVVSWILQFIPGFGKSLRSLLLSNFGGYLHCGNMRYLSNCSNGDYNKVKLLYSVSILYRIKGLIVKKLPWQTFLGDHSISIYRKKLTTLAQNRSTIT